MEARGRRNTIEVTPADRAVQLASAVNGQPCLAPNGDLYLATQGGYVYGVCPLYSRIDTEKTLGSDSEFAL